MKYNNDDYTADQVIDFSDKKGSDNIEKSKFKHKDVRFQRLIRISFVKISKTNIKTLLLGVWGGIFYSVFYMIAIHLWSYDETSTVLKVLGSIVFGIGGVIIIYAMGLLITTNMVLSSLVFKGKVKSLIMLENLGLIMLGNFLGSILIASFASVFFFNEGHLTVLKHLIEHKMHNNWSQNLFSGFLCNILVVGTMWISLNSKDHLFRIIVITLGISTYMIMGLNHTVSNFFLFSLTLFPKIENIFANQLWFNILPTFFGNVLSGSVFLPLIYMVVDSKNISKDSSENLLKNINKSKKVIHKH